MKISPYAIENIVPFITGDYYPPYRSGQELIKLFNNNGFRDVYDENGLPDIGKRNRQRPSRKEYVKSRLILANDKNGLREILTLMINELNLIEVNLPRLNEILSPEGYNIIMNGESFLVQGGTIDRRKPIVNHAQFHDIQDRILIALDRTKVSIRLVMAWFTNETLLNKLLELKGRGIDIQIAIYDDGINRKYGVDLSRLSCTMIKQGKKGGLMHNKFCVIDNQIVITGSYNWTNNAEYRNSENITIEFDPEQATRFSEEYRKLTT